MSGQSLHRYAAGDSVRHTGKPEWGGGSVERVQNVMVNGVSAQRLTVRFERAGRKTLLTTLAGLRPAGAEDRAFAVDRPEEAGDGRAGHDPFAERDPVEVFSAIPEGARDGSRPLAERVAETVKLYRFSRSSGSLLDWAATQSGLADPLSRFSRAELELMFERFETARDRHLADLLHRWGREDRAAASAALARIPGPILDTIRRINSRR